MARLRKPEMGDRIRMVSRAGDCSLSVTGPGEAAVIMTSGQYVRTFRGRKTLRAFAQAILDATEPRKRGAK
jgi:hypothetical protein